MKPQVTHDLSVDEPEPVDSAWPNPADGLVEYSRRLEAAKPMTWRSTNPEKEKGTNVYQCALLKRMSPWRSTNPKSKYPSQHKYQRRKLQAALLPTTHCGHKQPALKENKTIRKGGTAEHQLWWFLCPSLVFWVLTLRNRPDSE